MRKHPKHGAHSTHKEPKAKRRPSGQREERSESQSISPLQEKVNSFFQPKSRPVTPTPSGARPTPVHGGEEVIDIDDSALVECASPIPSVPNVVETPIDTGTEAVPVTTGVVLPSLDTNQVQEDAQATSIVEYCAVQSASEIVTDADVPMISKTVTDSGAHTGGDTPSAPPGVTRPRDIHEAQGQGVGAPSVPPAPQPDVLPIPTFPPPPPVAVPTQPVLSSNPTPQEVVSVLGHTHLAELGTEWLRLESHNPVCKVIVLAPLRSKTCVCLPVPPLDSDAQGAGGGTAMSPRSAWMGTGSASPLPIMPHGSSTMARGISKGRVKGVEMGINSRGGASPTMSPSPCVSFSPSPCMSPAPMYQDASASLLGTVSPAVQAVYAAVDRAESADAARCTLPPIGGGTPTEQEVESLLWMLVPVDTVLAIREFEEEWFEAAGGDDPSEAIHSLTGILHDRYKMGTAALRRKDYLASFGILLSTTVVGIGCNRFWQRTEDVEEVSGLIKKIMSQWIVFLKKGVLDEELALREEDIEMLYRYLSEVRYILTQQTSFTSDPDREVWARCRWPVNT
ncbi:hypothetical protein KIPB_007009 [Kipferlia bialata]|uniref:Uncharacterized protein n=1 Tax=Kipferlia bialata TaxID=797122 RepID=A0A9K3CVU8_9EUKA|nr:hypothetical protein KIPB_003733 [Kipferlia bialata]GIQ83243.1 hypothetical protein KIPB_004534 [Kipferlia bialata]GIQ83943.1 hypothetical protein KIPB_005350 [Kipferlia bialata]GIQ85359.1 hypothetical protein KIPB_007009 [Kipferlia bialata]|eukprot:g3733.t1